MSAKRWFIFAGFDYYPRGPVTDLRHVGMFLNTDQLRSYIEEHLVEFDWVEAIPIDHPASLTIRYAETENEETGAWELAFTEIDWHPSRVRRPQ